MTREEDVGVLWTITQPCIEDYRIRLCPLYQQVETEANDCCCLKDVLFYPWASQKIFWKSYKVGKQLYEKWDLIFRRDQRKTVGSETSAVQVWVRTMTSLLIFSSPALRTLTSTLRSARFWNLSKCFHSLFDRIKFFEAFQCSFKLSLTISRFFEAFQSSSNFSFQINDFQDYEITIQPTLGGQLVETQVWLRLNKSSCSLIFCKCLIVTFVIFSPQMYI